MIILWNVWTGKASNYSELFSNSFQTEICRIRNWDNWFYTHKTENTFKRKEFERGQLISDPVFRCFTLFIWPCEMDRVDRWPWKSFWITDVKEKNKKVKRTMKTYKITGMKYRKKCGMWHYIHNEFDEILNKYSLVIINTLSKMGRPVIHEAMG